ncbi:MAG: dihydroorotate dehydrogenase-like protein [Ignavibacteriae bacterium]|nr:MAG: dihydroorotate dehydrogenase-like protein [Ignavibacteriota bacterium]
MDLSTTYLGMKLKNPIVASASPLSRSMDSMHRLEDAGASAIVMHSLFEEQVANEADSLEFYKLNGTESFAEALTYFPDTGDYHFAPEEYLELIAKASTKLEIPVIGSLNGVTPGGWTQYARKMEEAGASALELNIYYIATSGTMSGSDVENRYVEILKQVHGSVKIPVAVKLSPFFSSIPNVAQRLVNEGAAGLVLFNRFYQPDIDLDELDVKPGVELSDSYANRLPMRWIGILFGKCKASLAATSGIHTAEDVLKLTMAGADVTMMCSALLKNGPVHISNVLKNLEHWMGEHEYESMEQMKGSLSHKSIADPSSYERANYMKALNRYKLLV